MNMCAIVLATLCLISMPVVALGQTDEIQVYNAEIAPPGIFNLMIYNNFTPRGRTAPDYPGAIIANHSYRSLPSGRTALRRGLSRDCICP
jgi:hypothetical protein